MDFRLNHIHISERQAGSWVDCVPTSAVEFARMVGKPSIPHTLAEAKALRKDSGVGPTGGMTVRNILSGLAKRYGLHPASVTGFAALWAALAPGTAAIALGSMAGFPAGHKLRRWDPAFAGGHAVCLIKNDSGDRVLWCDPLAPLGTYQGEWVSKADLAKFINAAPTFGAIVAKVKMPAPVPAPKPAPKPVPPVVVPPPAPVPPPAVDPTPFSQADLNAAVAAQVEADKLIMATANAQAVQVAVADEQARIRGILGL